MSQGAYLSKVKSVAAVLDAAESPDKPLTH